MRTKSKEYRMASPMTEIQVKDRISEIPGWEFRDGKLYRGFVFESFVAAFGWMASMALVAEAMNHHPDWKNVYNRVEVELSTHDAGGVTDADFRLALQMNRLARK